MCAWTAGCEHRQMQTEAIEREVAAAVDAVERELAEDEIGMTPYLTDLWTYHQRACEAFHGPVCVHCVALQN